MHAFQQSDFPPRQSESCGEPYPGFSNSRSSGMAFNMNGRFHGFTGFASAPASPQITMRSPSPSISDNDKYLSELLAERQKLSPFMQVLPNCSRLLNQEIVRITALVGSSSFMEQDNLESSPHSTSSSLSLPNNYTTGHSPFESNTWAPMAGEAQSPLQLMQGTNQQSPSSSPFSWAGQPSVAPIVKKSQRIDVPVDQYPAFNFVGRILGPRGNSLKRVEAQTGCRVLIRGRGSIKDSLKEEKMRDKPGFEHLNEPLHVIIEAELPASIVDTQIQQACDIIEELLKPVEETFDVVKRAQLRELAILNGTLRDESASQSFLMGTPNPFQDVAGMKRAKTRR